MLSEDVLEESQNSYGGRMCERMLAYRAECGLGCRTSVKAGLPSVRCTGRNDLGPQLAVPELTQLGVDTVVYIDKKVCR